MCILDEIAYTYRSTDEKFVTLRFFQAVGRMMSTTLMIAVSVTVTACT